MSVRNNGSGSWIARLVSSNFSSRNDTRLAVAAAALFTLTAFVQQPVRAALIHGDFFGATVDYIGVEEDTSSGDTLPLFGRPTVIGPAPPPNVPCVACAIPGNSLDFTPENFNASASGTNGTDQTDGRLSFMVVAHQGVAIELLQLAEGGDTALLGFTEAFASVAATGTINIIEVDGQGVALAPIHFALTFTLLPTNTPTDATWSLSDDAGGGFSYTNQWAGNIVLDLEALLDDANVDFDLGVTKLTVNLDNTLQALSDTGAFATISKKEFGGLSVTVVAPDPGGDPDVPEPASLGLLGVAVACMAVVCRRSTR